MTGAITSVGLLVSVSACGNTPTYPGSTRAGVVFTASGRVVSAVQPDKGIAGVSIYVPNLPLATTDSAGAFSLSVVGLLTLPAYVSHPDYQPLQTTLTFPSANVVVQLTPK